MKTQNDRQAWRAKIAGLMKQVKAMPEAARQELAAKMGTVTPEGHTLSLHNTALLWLQARRPLPVVAGFKQWQRHGRLVKKGEHAAGYIHVPLMRKHGDTEAEDGEQNEPDELRGFRLVPVFAIDQTEERGAQAAA